MRYLSVCSGIEAASVAWHHLGWKPVAFSEIEPFPSAVLAHHYPQVPNYGDMTKFQEWPIEPGTVDLLVGGTPCQSFSVAGLRKGISDPRGGLMLTYLEIALRFRPRWVVWENVPGVLSSAGGRDFGSFLGALGELGYGWAYRVLDAQWCRTHGHPRAVPQRRRRVFVVGHLGDWSRAAKVLFERESVQRDSSTRRAKGQGAPADAEAGAGAGLHETVGALCADTHPDAYSGQDAYTGRLIPQPVAGTLGNRGLRSHIELDGHGAYVPVPFTKSKRAQSTTDDETWVDGQVNPTLSLFDQGDTRATTVAVAFTPGNLARGAGPSPNAEVAPTQRCSAGRGADDQRTCVAFSSNMSEPDFQTDGTTPTVRVGSGLEIPAPPAVAHAMTVETLQQQGYNGDHASTQEANAIATLRVLRDEIGEEAFAAWGLGVLDSLQPSQVLRARLHGEGIRCASFSRSWPIDCAISRPEDRAAWAVQSVREAEGEGCSPSRRELPQQLAEQLGAYLSQLPCPGPQAEKLMHHLWCAGEGIGILRYALSTIQEVRRSLDVPRTTPANTMTVRRLTATECEFLQGFPRNYTLIPWRGKPAEQCPDGPRYKALGNSMAVNCMAWIGERIAIVDSLP